jgi:DNA-damage-inducible protein D
MDRGLIRSLNRKFEEAATDYQGVEAWFGRDLQPLLEYEDWRNFQKVIEKARTACSNSGEDAENHFVEVTKMVLIGSGSEREIMDILVSRYGCYLIAQNADPKKQPVAFAQTYFALQTRRQEVLEERLEVAERLEARDKLTRTEKELSGVLYQRGVDDTGFAIIRSRGDAALFGGRTTLDMKRKLGVPQERPLADFLPTVTIKAKDLATEITNYTVRSSTMRGEATISGEHIKNNMNVREALTKSGIFPENLPPEEDIKKLKRRVDSEIRRLPKTAKAIPKIFNN